MCISKREYESRVEELIWCCSLQEKIWWYLDICDEQRISKAQRIEILVSLLAKYMSEKDIDNELRNFLKHSVINVNKFVTEYWHQMRLAKSSELYE